LTQYDTLVLVSIILAISSVAVIIYGAVALYLAWKNHTEE